MLTNNETYDTCGPAIFLKVASVKFRTGFSLILLYLHTCALFFFLLAVFIFLCGSVLDVCSINNDAYSLWCLHASLYTWSVSLNEIRFEISSKFFAQ